MNQELKSLINSIFDAEKLVVDGVQKNYFQMVTDGMALLGDIPADIAGGSDLLNELKNLSQAAYEQDLLAYLAQKLASIPQLAGAKPAAVLAALVNFINAGYALEQACVAIA